MVGQTPGTSVPPLQPDMNAPFALTRRHIYALWVALSSVLAVVGAVGPWLTLSTIFGGASFSGTYIGSRGSGAFGAGWDVLVAAIAAGAIALLWLFHSSRWPLRLAAFVAGFAAVDVIYVMIRSARVLTDSNKYASVSWGWGIFVALFACLSLLVALVVCGRTALSSETGARQPDGHETQTAATAVFPVAPSARRRGTLLLGALLVVAVTAAVIEGVVLAGKSGSLSKAHRQLAADRRTISTFPTRLTIARQNGYSNGFTSGSDTEDTKYEPCYGQGYSSGYLEGWNAAVDELNTTGSVQGGASDPWWDDTTLDTCSVN